jgi:hypothetical protein
MKHYRAFILSIVRYCVDNGNDSLHPFLEHALMHLPDHAQHFVQISLEHGTHGGQLVFNGLLILQDLESPGHVIADRSCLSSQTRAKTSYEWYII